VDDVIALTGNITLARSADAIKTNVTNGQTMALVGGGSTLRGGLARVLDVNGSGAGAKVAIDNLTMTSGTGILIGEAGTGVIGKDAQRAGIWVGSEFTEMAKSMIDVAGGVGVEWGRADAAEPDWPAC